MRLGAGALIVTLALSILLAPVTADAQRAAKVLRIGYLLPGSPSDAVSQRLRNAFLERLRELGYVEGQNIAIEYRAAEGRDDRLPGLAEELVRLKVDVILVAGHTPAIQAAKRATSAIPIVMAVSGDPVGTGLVTSLARPGGNVTGLSIQTPELASKRLELLKEAVPRLSRVAVLWNPANPVKVLDWQETQAAARPLGLKLQSLEVRGPSDFDGVFEVATRDRADALIAFSDGLINMHMARIVDFAAKTRLPAMYPFREFVDAGGLISYAPSFTDLYRRAATYVDKILKGAKPADLPVEQPTRFELVVNLKTAKALGLTIPPSILIRADHVIQ